MTEHHPRQPLAKTALFAGLPAIGAGLIAGAVHLIVLMVLVPLFPTHLLFGVTAAWGYQALRQRRAAQAPGAAQEPPEQRRAA